MENYPALSARERELRYVTPEEYQQLLNYLENGNHFKKDRVLLLVKLLWHTGARISEILTIKAKDIDFRERIINIKVLKKDVIFEVKRKNLRKAEVEKYKITKYIELVPSQIEDLMAGNAINLTNTQVKEWHLKIPPTINRIPINTTLTNELELYILHHTIQPNAFLFKLTRVQAWKIISALSDEVLHKHFHPHSFRHGFAMNLLEQNVSPAVIQSLLKHSSLNTTFNTYAVPTLEMKRKALENR